MIEKVKRVMNKGRHFTMLLNDLSKTFDSLPHDLIIAKLNACGFKNVALCLILNYLNNKKEGVKVNSSFSSFQNMTSRVPQSSLLGPYLFNIFLTDSFLFCPTELASYADDSIPDATGDCLKNI